MTHVRFEKDPFYCCWKLLQLLEPHNIVYQIVVGSGPESSNNGVPFSEQSARCAVSRLVYILSLRAPEILEGFIQKRKIQTTTRGTSAL